MDAAVAAKDIDREVERLNGATAQLARDVQTIKSDREVRRLVFSGMLDDALRALNRKNHDDL